MRPVVAPRVDTTCGGGDLLKLYEGHYHDLLNDIGKEHMMADVTSWMAARIA